MTPERHPLLRHQHKIPLLEMLWDAMTWLGNETNLSAPDWGWNNRFQQVMCASSATPDSLLKVVYSYCQTACTSRRGACRWCVVTLHVSWWTVSSWIWLFRYFDNSKYEELFIVTLSCLLNTIVPTCNLCITVYHWNRDILRRDYEISIGDQSSIVM